MYNIIESKYRYIFLICIIGIVLFLFINSGSIIEGLTAKQKREKAKKAEVKKAEVKKAQAEAKKVETQANAMAAAEIQQQITGSPVLAPSATSAKATTETVKKEVKAQLPSLVSGVLAKPVTDIKNTQAKILAELRQVSSIQADLKKRVSNVNVDMKKGMQENKNRLKKSYDKLSSNLSQQYDMYKTGIANEGSAATNSIKNLNKSVTDASSEAVDARDKSKEYADLSNKIYNDVFGGVASRVIQQDNAEFSGKQGFTPMNGSGYTNGGVNNKNLFDLEKQLVDAINDFNTSYYNFIRCSSGGSVNCGNNATAADVEAKSRDVIFLVNRLQVAYNTEKTNIQTNDGTFKTNHQEIMDKSKSIDEFRRNLDAKMDAILKNRNPPNELTQQYDSTVYTGIMWSVLATSVLFYVFTEL
jgi:hypothetical protein